MSESRTFVEGVHRRSSVKEKQEGERRALSALEELQGAKEKNTDLRKRMDGLAKAVREVTSERDTLKRQLVKLHQAYIDQERSQSSIHHRYLALQEEMELERSVSESTKDQLKASNEQLAIVTRNLDDSRRAFRSVTDEHERTLAELARHARAREDKLRNLEQDLLHAKASEGSVGSFEHVNVRFVTRSLMQ